MADPGNTFQDVDGWEVIRPPFMEERRSRRVFTVFAGLVSETLRGASTQALAEGVDAVVREGLGKSGDWPRESAAEILAASLVLADLARQGWAVRVGGDGTVAVRPPSHSAGNLADRKAEIRRQELVRRDQQLTEPSVQEFVRWMEKRRLFEGRFVSIFSLMRDGREFARPLREARNKSPPETFDRLGKACRPYLQFVTDLATCEWTGLRLMDVWRYFRHTWVNQYGSVPGRSMMLLVRDAGAANHPVVGIAAISSPVVQLRSRDTWIGWHPETFVEEARRNPTDRLARWLVDTVDAALNETFTRDFLERRFLPDATDNKARTAPLTPSELRSPTAEVIALLVRESIACREKHRSSSEKSKFKGPTKSDALRDDAFWEGRSRTYLYRSKRAGALAEYFQLRDLLRTRFGSRPTAKKLATLLDEPKGVRAVQRVLRKAKGDRVGVLMGDISVCGAIQPYSALTGGKLVAMLATSPEVVAAYRGRYSRAASEIASSMAGRTIVREPHLVFLGTTSLFGGSSQYNRIAIPADRIGGPTGKSIRYIEQGESDAYGTSQFSGDTVEALMTLANRAEGGRRVNFIFGEGQSPKMRMIREELDRLGYPSSVLLKHGRRRVIYCIPLIENVRDFLIGLAPSPRYIVPQRNPRATSEAIGAWWRERWLSRRIESEDVLASVERNTLVYPVIHGARVSLPGPKPGKQHPLFPG